MPKVDEYLTVKEAAEYLGVSPNTLRKCDRDGKIPVYRHPISNYRLFRVLRRNFRAPCAHVLGRQGGE